MFIIVSTLVKQHVSPVEQELPVVEHLAAYPGCQWECSLQILCYMNHCLSFCPFPFYSLYCLFFFDLQLVARMAQLVRQLDLTAHTSLSPVRRGFAPSFVNYNKRCTRIAAVSVKFTNCLPRVGGSLRVLRLLPPLTLFAMIQLKYC